MKIEHSLKYYKKKAKIVLHKAGQILFKPAWNCLPQVASYESVDLCIVLTKRCSANCIFCGYQFLPKNERINMLDTVFLSLITNIKSCGILSVHITSNVGDPLCAPNLIEKIREFRKAGVRSIQLTTNAILLDRIGIDKFLEDGPDIVTISTTAFDADMYKRIYRSDQYERMRRNVMNLLIENRKRSKPRHISIGIRPDISKDDVLAMPETNELIELADEVEITEAYADWLGLIKDSMLTGTMRIEKPVPLSNRPCRVLTEYPAIYPNGDIMACVCRNINNDPEMYLGNILETDLKSGIDNIRSISRNWRNGRIPKTCELCSMYGDPSYYWLDYLRKGWKKATGYRSNEQQK